MNGTVFLHIGMHKCASTFLQRQVFPHNDRIHFIYRQLKSFENNILDVDRAFDPCGWRRELFFISADSWTSKATVISSEGFAGEMFTGRGAKEIADRVAVALDVPNVIAVVRNPWSAVYAIWNQYIQEGGCLSLEAFLTSDESPCNPRVRQGAPGIWQRVQWMNTLDYWTRFLDGSRVKVFFLEDLAVDAAAFLRNLFDYLGIDPLYLPVAKMVRTGYPHWLAQIKVRANAAFSSHHHRGPLSARQHSRLRLICNMIANKVPRVDVKPSVIRYCPDDIRDQIKAANARLATFTGRDLNALGYEC